MGAARIAGLTTWGTGTVLPLLVGGVTWVSGTAIAVTRRENFEEGSGCSASIALLLVAVVFTVVESPGSWVLSPLGVPICPLLDIKMCESL